MILLFYFLFGKIKNSILIYDKSWWDFPLETWDIERDQYNYDLKDKSRETRKYLEMLQISGIQKGFSGSCTCFDWDTFLPIILKCIVTHQAPYSPIFYNKENDFFFYFHHSGSIGFYYHTLNKSVKDVLQKASKEYELR